MRRADEPLEEERRALRVLCGGIGIIIGATVLGSALVGLTIGIASAGALIDAHGTTGLWAREIAAQAAQFAESRSLPEYTQSAIRTAKTMGSAALAELRVFADLKPVRSITLRLSTWAALLWARVHAWAKGVGLTVRLQSLWRASHVDDFLAQCRENIEQRRRAQGMA
eukprot:CAMPEP_0174697752 /NCGR_PEP_ID=MMETSP1094-20130205/3523_1 /TAXON_ID=156173 /ORGANISM="Chrysochromulina brevifilum, Strain UTEX LB 985" /LENGTH=167 /DNA_ID=CAMNT_0015894789 /DNA_START=326 /DNA_END=829 /DNA_ORIENTATION=+